MKRQPLQRSCCICSDLVVADDLDPDNHDSYVFRYVDIDLMKLLCAAHCHILIAATHRHRWRTYGDFRNPVTELHLNKWLAFKLEKLSRLGSWAFRCEALLPGMKGQCAHFGVREKNGHHVCEWHFAPTSASARYATASPLPRISRAVQFILSGVAA